MRDHTLMPTVRALLSGTAFAVASLVATQARADDTADPPAQPTEGSIDPATQERSRKLFDEARALAEQNRWADACPLFEAAHTTNATGGTALQLARCYEMTQKPDKAAALYQWIVERRATQPESRVAIAETRLRELSQNASAPAKPESPPEPAPAPTPAPPLVTAQPGPTSVPQASERPNRVPAYVSLGVGGAGLVVGSIFGGLALSQASRDLKDGKPDEQASATAKAWVSNIGFGVAVVGVAVGVVLLVTQKPARADTAVRVMGRGVSVRF